jgi:hypothetical protein
VLKTDGFSFFRQELWYLIGGCRTGMLIDLFSCLQCECAMDILKG